MKTTTCKQCGKAFKQKNDGRRRFCSECVTQRNIDSASRNYYRRKQENPELLKENHRRWKQAQRGFKEGSLRPWRFEWNEGFPVIKDAKGSVVCSLSTGTLEGAYPQEKILANAQRLLRFNT